jgi:putative oxidoreductase
MSTVTRVSALLTRSIAVANRLQPVGLLLARVVVGLVFVFSGWGKLHDLDTVIGYFRELGIPAPELQAPFVAMVEFVGGLAVLAGLGTRFAAIPLSGTMVVAIITAKLKDVTSPKDLVFFSETDYLVMLFILVVFGGGALSVDALLKRKTPAPTSPMAAATLA